MIINHSRSFKSENGYDCLWPIHIESKDGALTADVYYELTEKLSFLENMTEEQVFGSETIDKIVSIVDGMLDDSGYEIRYGKNYIYKLQKRDDVNKSLILDSSEVLLPDHGYTDLIGIQPELLDEGFLCFATVVDGEIVSIASENGHGPDSTEINIGVETAEGHKNKGYGASNIAALSYYLLDSGITVLYTVDDENHTSIRLCERVGFKKDSRTLDVFCLTPEMIEQQEG